MATNFTNFVRLKNGPFDIDLVFPDLVSRVRSDPRSFIEEIRTPAILDEIQNTPEILNYVRSDVDRHPSGMGRWYLTGSQDAPLMKGVTESMAGRAAVILIAAVCFHGIA